MVNGEAGKGGRPPMGNWTDKELDTKISEALFKGTEEAHNLKDTVWLEIQKKLEAGEEASMVAKPREDRRFEIIGDQRRSFEKRGAQKRVQKGRVTFKWLSVAAALALVFLVGTEPGQAAFNKMKEIFLPEKNIVEELEGQKEKSRVSLHESKEANYVIYFDKERYKAEKSAEKERIVPLVQPTGDYPEVFMEISQVKDKTPEEVAREFEKELKRENSGEFPKVENQGQVEQPVQGIFLSALSGMKHNSKVTRYYLVDNKLGGTIVIKQQYFLEAEEGHGVRFNNMLKEFKVLDERAAVK